MSADFPEKKSQLLVETLTGSIAEEQHGTGRDHGDGQGGDADGDRDVGRSGRSHQGEDRRGERGEHQTDVLRDGESGYTQPGGELLLVGGCERGVLHLEEDRHGEQAEDEHEGEVLLLNGEQIRDRHQSTTEGARDHELLPAEFVGEATEQRDREC